MNVKLKLNDEIWKKLKVELGMGVGDVRRKGVGRGGGSYKMGCYEGIRKGGVKGV